MRNMLFFSPPYALKKCFPPDQIPISRKISPPHSLGGEDTMLAILPQKLQNATTKVLNHYLLKGSFKHRNEP